jgi:hypothetical protein
LSFYKGNFRLVYFTVVNAGDGFSNIAVINTNVGSDAGPNLSYLVFSWFCNQKQFTDIGTSHTNHIGLFSSNKAIGECW